MGVIRAVLFDLDGTLVDSRPLDVLRKAREWRKCKERAGECTPFKGIAETLLSIPALFDAPVLAIAE